MPKVLIMSDSHGLEQEVQVIKARHKDADAMIHCGDSELAYGSETLNGFYYAKGNCDFEPDMENEQVLTVGDVTFYVTHGHLHQVKTTLMPLKYKAQENEAQVACFGHSHIAGAEVVDGVLLINPGSARLPRDREEPTYALLEWDDPAEATLQFYHVNGEKMDGLVLSTDLTAKN
ncbi:metallophosphoesterase [Halobacillus sp. ACCC02827]|uniref:metallophosphoesterase n=1 Tax=Halobacillus sp. ACCC02827 TaxID=3052090 RepID=UPI00256FCD56|nr:metallophosphoesterase [Halobacillus sp. ACCC02827]WJE14564.1 metallophosphoesterase [Halobacillus sp. ACCC02827]